MIEYLSGIVRQRLPHGVILDVQGVGYGLALPLPAVASLPREGNPLQLWVYTRVREDAISLYGFMERAERQAFEVLLAVNGVGPKVALAILSTLRLSDLREAVASRQCEQLHAVPGIGKRTAEKIIVELQTRLDRLPDAAGSLATPSHGAVKPSAGLAFADESAPAWPLALEHDLVSALSNLGFKDKDTEPLLASLRRDYAGEDFSGLLKKALALVGKRQEVQQKLKKHAVTPAPVSAAVGTKPRAGASAGAEDLDDIF